MKYLPVVCLIILLFTGCTPNSSADIFRVPGHPKEYAEFNNELNRIRNDGASFVEPSAGAHRQAVQLMDLDSDGSDEGIVFFRDSNNTYKVSLYLFKRNGDGRFTVFDIVEGPGSAVQTVAFPDLFGNANSEIVVGWDGGSDKNNILTVYSMQDGIVELMSIEYQHYVIYDMNADGIDDLSVIYDDKTGRKKIAMYVCSQNTLVKTSETWLSKGIKNIERIRTGVADGDSACIYIESTYVEQGIVTDLIVFNDKLDNITLDPDSGVSLETMRKYPAFTEDVNGDGVLEIPKPVKLAGPDGENGDAVWGILWQRVKPSGKSFEDIAFTYHSYIDNWYIMMPVEWSEHIIIRYESKRFGETAIEFFETSVTGKAEKLFTIYSITGDNRAALAGISGRFTLAAKGSQIYAAEIHKDRLLKTRIDEEFIKQAFRFRQNELTMGENVF